MYSDIADHASVPANSRSHKRFSAEVSARVVVKCHNIASGTARVRTLDIAKSAVFGVSKPRPQVNAKPATPPRLSATEIAVIQRGTVAGGKVDFIGSPASQLSEIPRLPQSTRCDQRRPLPTATTPAARSSSGSLTAAADFRPPGPRLAGCRTPIKGSLAPPGRGPKIRQKNIVNRVQSDIRCPGMEAVRLVVRFQR
jgi:hypothetical protein